MFLFCSPDTPPPNIYPGTLPSSFKSISGNKENTPSPRSNRRYKPNKARRNGSRGNNNNNNNQQSPAKKSTNTSVTKENLHRELESKAAAVSARDGTHSDDQILPSSIKKAGPDIPLRELSIRRIQQYDIEDDKRRLKEQTVATRDSVLRRRERSPGTTDRKSNLNDVCFGCDGSCGDTTCDSKRSSRASADVESNGQWTPSSCTSPAQDTAEMFNVKEEPRLATNENCDDAVVTVTEDSNQNMVKSTEEGDDLYRSVTVPVSQEDSENGNPPAPTPRSPTSQGKWLPRSPSWETKIPPPYRTQRLSAPSSLSSGIFTQSSAVKKRMRSDGSEDLPTTKRGSAGGSDRRTDIPLDGSSSEEEDIRR